MTCLVYPTYSSYSFSSATLRALQGGRGHHLHPHHLQHHPEEHHLPPTPAPQAVDLRQQVATSTANMLEDASVGSSVHGGRVLHATSAPASLPASLPAAMFPAASPPTTTTTTSATSGGKNSSPQQLDETPHYPHHLPGRLPYGRPASPPASPANTDASCASPGPPETRGVSLLEDARRQGMTSPVSAGGMSDNEDDYVDIACDKSDSSGGDSSGGSPHGKRSSSAGGAGSGGSGAGGGEKKVYRCQHCKYITDRKNNLKRHVVTMHEMCTKTLECCDVVFKNKASLRDHVVSCHKNGYDCRICGRTFCRKALLKRHITVHSGQKDYICGVCGYATSHKSNLDRHKRRHGPKFASSDEGEMGSVGCKSPPTTPSSSTVPHRSPLTLSHRSNPLDVSNLVNRSPPRGEGRYGPGYGPGVHRPEPVKPAGVYPHPHPDHPGVGPLQPVDYSRPPVGLPPHHRQPDHHYLENQHHLENHHSDHHHPNHHPEDHHPENHLHPENHHHHTGHHSEHQHPADHLLADQNHHPAHHHSLHGAPRRPRPGRYLLAKRLLYTYRRDGNSENINHNSPSINNNNNNDNNAPDDNTDCKVFNTENPFTRGSGAYLDCQVRLGLEKRMSAKRLLTSGRKVRLSSRRLFPALYVCRRCSVVYENQLQLTEHVERAHRDEDCPHLPQRPLTLQARCS